MKWSLILHGLAAASGILGAIVVIIWWVVLVKEGTPIFSLNPEHLYDDALILFLASIAFGIGALIHQNTEKEK